MPLAQLVATQKPLVMNHHTIPPARLRTWVRALSLLAILGGTLLATSEVSLLADTLVEARAKSAWRYWHSPEAPPATWRDPSFDDTRWSIGSAPLGCDERSLKTSVCNPANRGERPVTAYFPHGIRASGRMLQRVLLLRADDGAVVYLNGVEVARFNLPAGAITHATRASKAVQSFDAEEAYHRFEVPAALLRPGRNVLAASVHQWTAPGDDLVFDLALRAPSQPLRIGEAQATSDALQITRNYLLRHRVNPEERIPDGYIDGGRGMQLDANGKASSHREILMVRRSDDPALRRHLDFARSPEVQALPPLARATRIARYIAKELAAPEGDQWAVADSMLLAAEYGNSPVLFGEMEKVCPSGVCRHRGLLFKLMGDEAGLKVALVRGNLKTSTSVGGHAWNELHLEDGRRLLVDIMNPLRDFRFPALTEPIALRYLSVYNAPLYGPAKASSPTKTSSPTPAQ